MKTCTLCKQEKPKSHFGKHKQKKDGLSSWCKLCARAKAKERMTTAEYKKQKQEYDKKRYEDNEIRKIKQQNAKKNYKYNKESHKQRIRKWQENHPEKVTAYKKNNKYKRREIINSSKLTAKKLMKWEQVQIKICSYCGTYCTENYQIDHIEPLANNGNHSLDNLTISCPTCNQSKSDKPLLIWLATKLNP